MLILDNFLMMLKDVKNFVFFIYLENLDRFEKKMYFDPVVRRKVQFTFLLNKESY